MSEELEASVQIGHVLAAKYRVDRILGAGGMGIVVAATHLQLDQLVALKFIRREAMTNPEVVSRFEREARAAVRLKSEHVARVIDVGRLDSGSPYIVMEYLEGQDLAGLLQQRGALPVAVACDFIVQACDAIAEAHGLGIVHRDLKPGNLFLATTSHGQQTIKILDFGISKTQTMTDPNMTRTQAIMGSPGYMSPEQMRSTKNVDGRTDLWSLGVILYELVAGRVPFQADTFTALCLKVAMDAHPPLPALPASLPAGFEAVVNRALEKDPALRYQSAIELAQALAPFGGPQTRDRAQRLEASPVGGQVSAGYRVVAAAPAQSTLHAAAGPVGSAADPGRSRRRALAGVAIAAVVALGVGVTATRHGGGTESTPAGPGSDPVPAAAAVAQPAQRPPQATASIPMPADATARPPVDAGVDGPGDARPEPVRKAPRGGAAAPAIDPYGSPD